MKILFEDSEGTAARAAIIEIPQPDNDGRADILTDHFTTIADDAGIPFQKNWMKKGESVVISFLTTSQELFTKWRKEFPDGETERFFARQKV
ncbi:MAG TPA: hypothetical protein VEC36_13860 [Patescibacteria group bacterium]|nr:hypothetical protein [Patescibacteria group bacterium]